MGVNDEAWEDLLPHNRAIFMLANVIQAVGVLGVLANDQPQLHAGYEERCNRISEWCLKECEEISLFGEHYDPQ